MNTSEDPEGLVRLGNERVLRARFNDARFFWQTDQKKKLADRVEDLKNVTFQAKLGSYYEKTERMVKLVKELGGDSAAERAAWLSKTRSHHGTGQGIHRTAGRGGRALRARAGRAGAGLARDLRTLQAGEHGRLDSGHADRPVVALADKLDTLRECFRIGMMPTGSKDPFALRRAAQGVVKILVEGELSIALADLARSMPTEVSSKTACASTSATIAACQYDEVNAAMAAGWSDLPDLRSTPAAAAGRFAPHRISSRWPPASSASKIFSARPNTRAATRFARNCWKPVRNRSSTTKSGAHRRAVLSKRVIAALRPKVDLFFDKVLVNAQDPQVRRNRLALLHNLLAEFKTFADFSEIVTNS